MYNHHFCDSALALINQVPIWLCFQHLFCNDSNIEFTGVMYRYRHRRGLIFLSCWFLCWWKCCFRPFCLYRIIAWSAAVMASSKHEYNSNPLHKNIKVLTNKLHNYLFLPNGLKKNFSHGVYHKEEHNVSFILKIYTVISVGLQIYWHLCSLS